MHGMRTSHWKAIKCIFLILLLTPLANIPTRPYHCNQAIFGKHFLLINILHAFKQLYKKIQSTTGL